MPGGFGLQKAMAVLSNMFMDGEGQPDEVALYVAIPSDAGGGLEVVGSGYQRIIYPNDEHHWQVTEDATVTNLLEMDWGIAKGGDWGIIKAIVIYNPKPDGIDPTYVQLPKFWVPLENPRPVTDGNGFKIEAQGILFALT